MTATRSGSFDPSKNALVGPAIAVGERTDDVAVWNDAVYVANQHGNTIMRIDPESRRVVGTLKVGNGPDALAPDGKWLWVLNFGAETAVRVRP